MGLVDALRDLHNEKGRIKNICISQYCLINKMLKITNSRHRRKYSKFIDINCRFFTCFKSANFFRYFPVTAKWYADEYARINIIATCVNKNFNIGMLTMHANYDYNTNTWCLSMDEIPKSLKIYPEITTFRIDKIEGKNLYTEISDVLKRLCYLHIC